MNQNRPRKHLLSTTALAAALSLSLSACGGADWEEISRASMGWMETREAEMSLYALLYSSGLSGVTPEEVASAAAEGVAGSLGACAGVEVDGAQVTYTFDGCDGDFGLRDVRGTVTATYAVDDEWDVADIVLLDVSSKDISANGKKLRFDYSGRNTVSLALWPQTPEKANTLTIAHPGVLLDSPVIEDGVEYMDGRYLNDACDDPIASPPRIAGLGTIAFESDDGNAVNIAWSNYERCGGGCPNNGGLMTLYETSKGDIMIELDGSATAKAVNGEGETIEIALHCTP